MSVNINLGAWNSIFAVPTKIVDEGLKFADGVKLKVLLYVLRSAGANVTDEDISRATGVNVIDVPEALDYWANLGVLAKYDDNYSAGELSSKKKDTSFADASEGKAITSERSLKEVNAFDNYEQTQNNCQKEKSLNTSGNEKASNRHFAVSRPKRPDYVFTARKLASDKDLVMLVDEAQSAFGKILSNSDVSVLLMLKDTCGLPLDVIVMLIQYCVSIGKSNIRTVEKIGISWADEGIDSLESAADKIEQTRITSRNFAVVSSSFGLRNIGSPTKKQLEYGDKWVGTWKFTDEMLREAYERCVDNKGQLNFRYIDGILKRWYAGGVKNLNDLETFEKNSGKKTLSGGSSSIDYDRLNEISIPDL